MKKRFLILALMLLVATPICFAGENFDRPLKEEHGKRPPQGRDFGQMQGHKPPSPEEFEKRLQLTDEQKALAKVQREESVEKIKPIIESIKSKKAELEKLNSDDEKAVILQNEIRALRRQAHEIRKENMKAFESTLTETQKAELKKMKEEGRKKFEQEHKKFPSKK